METLCASGCYPNLDFLMEETTSAIWTKEENKKFERALAIYDEKSPDRWLKVANMIPGKSVADVMRQYMELEADISDIEADLVPIPGYLTSSFTLEMVENYGSDTFRKRPLMGRSSSDQERKKGVPWTEDEHRRFLMGLQKHGKGDWRNISRNFVISKTPTQVASHAQKYFLRQNSAGKDKRRPSIHDITTIHLTDTNIPSKNSETPSLDKSALLAGANKSPNNGAIMAFDTARANPFMQYPYEIASHGLKLQSGAHLGPLNSLFQFQSTRYQIHG